jgi:gamma-glutamylcyclotransferase (GGCT)/AIG2-like uncharacterized protein YtfP
VDTPLSASTARSESVTAGSPVNSSRSSKGVNAFSSDSREGAIRSTASAGISKARARAKALQSVITHYYNQVEEYLFVYGTLRSEFENVQARKLREEARLMGRATVRGSIFRISHYPGFRASPDGEVHGELYCLTDPCRTLVELDGYEGAEYRRVLISVSTGGTAWIFEYASEPPAANRIDSGDFCRP